MPMISSCPDADTLQRLLLGQVSEAEAGPLEEHLADCTRCRALLPQLEGRDALIDTLRGGQSLAAELPRGEAVDRLMRRLHRLRPTAAQTPRELPPPGAERDQPAADADLDAADLLAPPAGPGEIGRLGPYRVVAVLGEGGMAVVFRAEDTQLQRPVALKVMKTGLLARGAARERFLRATRATASLEHDHIVPIFQVGEDRGILFLAMPLLQGESLDDRLRRQRPLPLAEVLRVGRETAEGLAAAHARGLVHRDVKPSNIWLDGPLTPPPPLPPRGEGGARPPPPSPTTGGGGPGG
jgi:eukaryotic-like serine/threonine-protein kinase